MMKGIQTLYFICFLLLLISCSSTKYVGEGEYLLDKVEIVSDGKTYKNSVRADEMAVVCVRLVGPEREEMDQ